MGNEDEEKSASKTSENNVAATPETKEPSKEEPAKEEAEKEEPAKEEAPTVDEKKDEAEKEEAPPQPKPIEESSAPCQDSMEAVIDRVTEALQKTRLFDNVDPVFTRAVAERAEYRPIPPGQKLETLEDSDCMYVVAKGALRIRVGGKSMVMKVAGPGTVLNGVGFLSLGGEAAAFRPRRQTDAANTIRRTAMGYDVEGVDRQKPVPQGYKELVHIGHAPPAPPGGEKMMEHCSSHLCFYGTCPYATVTGADWMLNDYLEMDISGAEPNEAPVEKQKASFQGGAVLAIIPTLKDIAEIGHATHVTAKSTRLAQDFPFDHDALEPVVDGFHKRGETLVSIWKTLMVRFSGTILPGAPPEVVWALAECAETFVAEAGRVIIDEGEAKDGYNDTLIIIAEGVAMVERRVRRTEAIAGVPGHLEMEVIGRIRPGAIIGDLCLIGAAVPRGATVRAKTNVEAIRIPAKKLMEVLHRFPGAVAGCASRLDEAGSFFEQRLPTRAEVVNSLGLFSGCDLGFISDIAHRGDRRTMLCGQPVMEEGSVGGALHVLEHGRCAVEINGVGQVAQVPAGNCFGERTLLGIAPSANATIRVITPFVVVLSIAKPVLEEMLEVHPDQVEHFEQMKVAPMSGRIAGSKVRNVELFRSCSTEFLADISKVVKTSGYMPGQAIFVEGDEDEDPRMLVLTGGRLMAERDGKEVSTMEPGFTFGELALLGIVEKRSVTVRAATFCYVMEIARSSFDAVVKQHPKEAQYFRETLMPSTQSTASLRVNWPFLHGVPQKLHHLMDLYAERRKCNAGDKILAEEPVKSAAVLVLEGTVALVNTEGKEVGKLEPGMCFNEQILAGTKERDDVKLIPASEVEVRVLSREKLQKVLAEFPQEKGNVTNAILRFMVEAAEVKLGHKPGSAGALCKSSGFCRNASPEFAKHIRSILEAKLYEPGAVITKAKSEETDMYILLEGVAHCETLYGTNEVLPVGSSFGEPKVLGIGAHYPGTLTATTLCIVHVLRRQKLDKVFEQFPREHELLTVMQDESGCISETRVRKMLQYNGHFKTMHQDCIRAICQGAEFVVYGPNHDIITLGEPCELGKTSFYMILAGSVHVGGPLGTLFGTVPAGGTFGEVGAFALTSARRANAKTYEGGLTACIEFKGESIEAALKQHPAALPPLSASCQAQADSNAKVEAERRRWLNEVAVPSLARTPLFVGCSWEFLHAVAVTTRESEFAAGQLMAVAGDATTSMLVMLSGTAELEAGPKAAKAGRLSEGAVFGEIAALGLFNSWMASLRATTPCSILKVTEAALKEAASNPGCEEILDGLQRLVVRRRVQVSKGLPLSALPYVGAGPEDPSVRSVALMAECVHLSPGELWEPIKDDDPCGPYFTIMLRGRATIEMSEECHAVMVLTPGSLLPEGLAAEFGARLRADTACEAYRVRQTDFNVAVHSNVSAQQWIWRYRLQEKSVHDHLQARLDSVHGLVKSIMPHTRDEEIHSFATRKNQNAARACKLRMERDVTRSDSKEHLPQVQDTPSVGPTLSKTGSLHRSRMMRTPSKAEVDHKKEVEKHEHLQLPQLTVPRKKGAAANMVRHSSEPAFNEQPIGSSRGPRKATSRVPSKVPAMHD